MSNENKGPVMEFPTNIPQTVKIIKKFSEGTNTYGQWYGYKFEHEGQMKIFFANEKLHSLLQSHQPDSIVTIKKEEKKKTEEEKAKNPKAKGFYHVWSVSDVNKAPSNQQQATKETKPSPVSSTVTESQDAGTLEGFREYRKKILVQALQDSFDIVKRFNGFVEKESDQDYKLNREDIRAIAISFMIHKERNGGQNA